MINDDVNADKLQKWQILTHAMVYPEQLGTTGPGSRIELQMERVPNYWLGN
jgi:hypothetical protein